MASTFHVLRARHTDPQIGKEIRTTDEVSHTQPGGLIFTFGRNLATWARSFGYESIIDPTGEYTDELGLTPAEAAEILGLPAGAVRAMIDAETLISFTHHKNGQIALLSEQVYAQAVRMERQRALAVDETGDVESTTDVVAATTDASEEEE